MVYFPMMNVTFPASLDLLFGTLIQVATFDIVPFIENINEYIWDFRHSNEVVGNLGFNVLGFDTVNFIQNSGSMFLLFLMFLI